MSTTRSVVPYIFASLHMRPSWRFQVSNPNLICPLATSKQKHKCQFLGNQRLQILTDSLELHHASNTKMNMAFYSSVESGSHLSSDPSPGSWKVWILGMIITVILPVWRNKWWPLLKLKDKVESIVETAEDVTNIVEKVAEEVEKVAEEAADHLPEGGKLKEAVTSVENVAKETAKDAHLAEEVIEKVQEVEKAVESLIEPVIDEDNGTTTKAKDIN